MPPIQFGASLATQPPERQFAIARRVDELDASADRPQLVHVRLGEGSTAHKRDEVHLVSGCCRLHQREIADLGALVSRDRGIWRKEKHPHEAIAFS